MTRREISPALLGSVLLHATVAVMFLISWNFTRDLKVGSVVPVTIPVPNRAETSTRESAAAPAGAAEATHSSPRLVIGDARPSPSPARTTSAHRAGAGRGE